MPLPTEHRFTVKEYYRMAETGVLRPDARVELLNGRIIDMSPIGPLHGSLVKRLNRLFMLKAMTAGLFPRRIPSVWRTIPSQPDLALLKPSPDVYAGGHPQPDEVFLLIEVSDSTLDYDREEKIPVYGRAGIAEVWIVNLTNATLEVYRDPHLTGYASKTVLSAGDQVPRPSPMRWWTWRNC